MKQTGTLRRVILQRIFIIIIYNFEEFPWWLSDKESAANAGDVGSIPGRFPEELNATHSSILAWKIPWMEERDGVQSMGS